SDKFMPAGFNYIKQFRQDVGVHFDYELHEGRDSSIVHHPSSIIKLTKSVYLLRDTDTVVLVYDFRSFEPANGGVEFVLRPFVGLRDFHTLQKSYAPLCSSWIKVPQPQKTAAGNLNDVLLVCSASGLSETGELFLSCPSMKFENDQQWWFNFVYRNDRERGQNFTEDLWTPGFFKCRIEAPTEIVLWATLSDGKSQIANRKSQMTISNPSAPLRACPELVEGTGLRQAISDLHRHQSTVIATAKAKDERFRILCLAADEFIVKRQTDENHPPPRLASEDARAGRTTILAGFPWFADWGRDAFVALPGLLLLTRRFDEARSVLTTFAQAADEGMIPNRFDDRSNTAYFNSVDASLWFINAAFQYLNATGDSKTFTQELLPVIRWIIDSYQKGTRFGIHADADGLITAGDNDTQLTWMDAKYEGVAFTPRGGKAVEVNSLWYNALCLIAQFYAGRNIENAKHYKSMADKVAGSFCELFWNEALGYLNDCILPDGSADTSLRPNQILAVSLPFSPPLSLQQKKSIVNVVQKELLTPCGLRTLNVQHSNYKGTYIGPQQQRDEAYHQGTVWPYLIGPFVEAYLKVNEFSRKSKKQAAEFIEPLMRHLTEDGCLGQIGEIFDGDAPHRPRGCIAQAWSVAELLRAYQLVND
ncbi:MAG: amylo-alpha-1,6-glucosidase, partial [Sedimentisphaerales bacterium]